MKNMCLWAAIPLMVLAACSNDDETASTNPMDYPAEIHGAIKDYAATETTQTSSDVWTAGDAIGVTTAAGTSNLSYVVTDDRNVKYIYNAEKGLFQVVSKEGEDHNIYFKGPYTMSMTAYFPYTGERGKLAGIIQATTTSDKQIGAARSSINFLYAEGGGSQTNSKVIFPFFHKMSQLVLTFKPGGGVVLNDISYKLKNIILDGSFHTATGAIVCGSTVGNISMSLAKSEKMNSSLILFPQKLTSTLFLELAMGGKTYAQPIGNSLDLASGNTYIFDVTIAPQAMTIGPAKIEDWIVGDNSDHYVIAGESE